MYPTFYLREASVTFNAWKPDQVSHQMKKMKHYILVFLNVHVDVFLQHQIILCLSLSFKP